MSMKTTYDVTVLGGGFLGLAIAVELAEKGLQVINVRPQVSKGAASPAAGGMLCVLSELSSNDAIERRNLDASIRYQARKMYDAWLAQTPGVTVRPGIFMLANTVGEDDVAELQTVRDAADHIGSKVHTVSPKEVPGLRPHAACKPSEAIYIEDEAAIDSSSLLSALQRRLETYSYATTVYGTAMAVETQGDAVVTKLMDGAVIESGRIVLANGAAISQFPELLDQIQLPNVYAGRGVSVAARTSITLPHAVRTPNRGFACGVHVVPRDDGTVYIGATNRFSTVPSLEMQPSFGELVNLFVGAEREINTAFSQAQVVNTWIGNRPLTVDKLPLVGKTRDPRVFVATGTYRNGMLLAPLIATIVADEITSGVSTVNHPFAVDRVFSVPSGKLDTYQVAESMISSFLEPYGSLPPHSQNRLTALLSVLLQSATGNDKTNNALLDRSQRFYELAQIPENIPLVLELIERSAMRMNTANSVKV